MSIGQFVHRQYWTSTFRISRKHDWQGLKIGTLLIEKEQRETIQRKVCDALDLIERYDSRQLARLRAHVAGIFVFTTSRWPLGSWMREARLIQLKEAYITDESVKPATIAATIVHETTHAWLEYLGFKYVTERRQRIEAICFRMEAAFARRIPDGDAAAEYYEERAVQILAEPSAVWSDATFVTRTATELQELGVPKWLLDRLIRYRNRRAA